MNNPHIYICVCVFNGISLVSLLFWPTLWKSNRRISMFALTSSKHDLSASYSQICTPLATLKAYLTVLTCCVFHNLASSNYLSIKLDIVVGKILWNRICHFYYTRKKRNPWYMDCALDFSLPLRQPCSSRFITLYVLASALLYNDRNYILVFICKTCFQTHDPLQPFIKFSWCYYTSKPFRYRFLVLKMFILDLA